MYMCVVYANGWPMTAMGKRYLDAMGKITAQEHACNDEGRLRWQMMAITIYYIPCLFSWGCL